MEVFNSSWHCTCSMLCWTRACCCVSDLRLVESKRALFCGSLSFALSSSILSSLGHIHKVTLCLWWITQLGGKNWSLKEKNQKILGFEAWNWWLGDFCGVQRIPSDKGRRISNGAQNAPNAALALWRSFQSFSEL